MKSFCLVIELLEKANNIKGLRSNANLSFRLQFFTNENPQKFRNIGGQGILSLQWSEGEKLKAKCLDDIFWVEYHSRQFELISTRPHSEIST